jgi:hypothetical protein
MLVEPSKWFSSAGGHTETYRTVWLPMGVIQSISSRYALNHFALTVPKTLLHQFIKAVMSCS